MNDAEETGGHTHQCFKLLSVFFSLCRLSHEFTIQLNVRPSIWSTQSPIATLKPHSVMSHTNYLLRTYNHHRTRDTIPCGLEARHLDNDLDTTRKWHSPTDWTERKRCKTQKYWSSITRWKIYNTKNIFKLSRVNFCGSKKWVSHLPLNLVRLLLLTVWAPIEPILCFKCHSIPNNHAPTLKCLWQAYGY